MKKMIANAIVQKDSFIKSVKLVKQGSFRSCESGVIIWKKTVVIMELSYEKIVMTDFFINSSKFIKQDSSC